MAEDYGVGVAQIEPVRRIAARVRLSPAAGRYFAVGKSPERRARVHAAFAALIGAEHLHVWDLANADRDPWNYVRSRQLAEALPTRGSLYCLTGLAECRRRAAETGLADPYAQLNFARDAWGSTGAHVLLWVDGPEELDALLRAAPDLWSHRDVVAWFLSRADFAVPAQPADDRWTPMAEAAQRTLADPTVTGDDRLRAIAELSAAYLEAGELLKAWDVLPPAPPVRRRRAIMEGEEQVERTARVALARLGRPEQALDRDGALVDSAGRLPAWRADAAEFAAALLRSRHRPEEAIPRLTRLISRAAGEARFQVRHNLVNLWARCGRPREAFAVLAEIAPDSAESRAWLHFRNATLAACVGDVPTSITEGLAANAASSSLGTSGMARLTSANIADLLDLWGDPEALTDFGQALEGDEAATFRTRVRQLSASWRRDDAATTDLLERVLAAVRLLARHPMARAVAADGLHDLLDTLDDDALPDDPLLPPLTHAAEDLLAQARQGHDDEIVGAARWALARLALLRGDPADARRHAGDTLIAWTRRWRGLEAESAVWTTLARCASDPGSAVAHAERSVAVADRSLSIYRQMRARQLAARVHLQAGAPTATPLRLLTEALALARQEGLRPRELDLLLDCAELPGHPDARRYARDALALAEVLAFPREQARALLDLALLSPEPADRGPSQRLERASEIAEALGPPRLRARVRAAIRGEPDLRR